MTKSLLRSASCLWYFSPISRVQEMWRSAVLRSPPFAFLWSDTGDHRQHGNARLSRCHGTCNRMPVMLPAGPLRNSRVTVVADRSGLQSAHRQCWARWNLVASPARSAGPRSSCRQQDHSSRHLCVHAADCERGYEGRLDRAGTPDGDSGDHRSGCSHQRRGGRTRRTMRCPTPIQRTRTGSCDWLCATAQCSGGRT